MWIPIPVHRQRTPTAWEPRRRRGGVSGVITLFCVQLVEFVDDHTADHQRHSFTSAVRSLQPVNDDRESAHKNTLKRQPHTGVHDRGTLRDVLLPLDRTATRGPEGGFDRLVSEHRIDDGAHLEARLARWVLVGTRCVVEPAVVCEPEPAILVRKQERIRRTHRAVGAGDG